MHKIWKSQKAEEKLEPKIWPVGHVFNVEIQEEAFKWLDRFFKK